MTSQEHPQGPVSRASSATDPARTTACFAPSSSLYLDQHGEVHACCENEWLLLGRYPDQELISIWQGPAAQELRDRLAAHDFSAGCHACSQGSLDALRGETAARRFDDLGDGWAADGWPRQLELQLSNRCNLACTMCTGLHSSTIRSGREGLAPLRSPYDEAFFEQLRPFLAHVQRIVLLGGEPFLAPEVRRVVEVLDEIGARPRFHITTNATVSTPWVDHVLEQFDVDLTVSLDGATAETFESIRVGARLTDVLANLASMQQRVEARGNQVTIATCLMRENWHELHEVLELADARGLDVFVNTVTDPSSSSLASLPARDIRSIAEHMAERGRDRPLERNAGVWERELRRIAALAAQEAALGDEDPEAALRRWAAPGPIVELRADQHQILVEVGPDASDVFGMDLRPTIGHPLLSWMIPLREHYGRLSSSSVRRYPSGASRWDLELSGDKGSCQVRAVGLPDGHGERWLIGLHREAATAVAVRSTDRSRSGS